MLGYGWVVVIDDCNIVIWQVGDTLFDEVAQKMSPVGPYFGNAGVELCTHMGRE